jgi:uncharacterized protein
MFIVDLAELQRRSDGRLEVQRRVDGKVICGELENITPEGQIKSDMVFTNDFGTISLKMNIEFDYGASCDRCASDIKNHMTLETNHVIATQNEKDITEEDEDVIIIDNYKLDVDELIFNDIVLNLPMKQLCSDECKGLCPQCGQNLNEGKCKCNAKTADPRWGKLLEYLNEEK